MTPEESDYQKGFRDGYEGKQSEIDEIEIAKRKIEEWRKLKPRFLYPATNDSMDLFIDWLDKGGE